jgi:hypothetical protein
LRPAQAKLQRPYLIKYKQKSWDVTQVECLPTMCKALDSIPNTRSKIKKDLSRVSPIYVGNMG